MWPESVLDHRFDGLDMASGEAYLNRLELNQPEIAERQLAALLDALLRAPPPAAVCCALLERMHLPLSFVAEELAFRYLNKPLPLAADEASALQRVVEDWQNVARAYVLCNDLALAEGCAPADFTALVLQRALGYWGLAIIENFRARRALPAALWQSLNTTYQLAEEAGVATRAVSDLFGNHGGVSHCTAAYLLPILVELAGPYSKSQHDLNLIRRWAVRWAPLVELGPIPEAGDPPAYCVDLASDCPLRPSEAAEQNAPGLRCLMPGPLAAQMHQAIDRLRHGETPSRLELGEESAGHVIALLEALLKPWTQHALPRRFRRFSQVAEARVAIGYEAMYFHVAGRPFSQPDVAAGYSREAFDALFTFRERVQPDHALTIHASSLPQAETWQVVNHSANGFRLTRRAAGRRLQHGQLLAVHPHDGEHFLLAHAGWLMEDPPGGLMVGVSMLPGVPQAIGVRLILDEDLPSSEHYVPAFLLPAMPAIGEAASLVIPSGLYKASRMLELIEHPDWRLLRMNHLLQRGMDFDRISFTRK